MNVLITGGLGFIGSHLAKKYVDLGAKVFIISKTKDKIKNIRGFESKINLIIKDVLDIDEEVAGKDIIFHLAGTTDNYNILSDPYKDITLNCNGSIALLEACKKHNSSAKIILASTFFVNGKINKLPADENSLCNPLGLYPATRLAAEHFFKIYKNVFGLNTLIMRFTNVFGPHEQGSPTKAGFNYLIKKAVNGENISVYSNGNFFRDYIYIDDVVDACIAIAEKGDSNKIYYVGNGDFVKFSELINIIKQETNAEVVSIDPPDFHKKVGIVDFVCDNSELKKIGWVPKVSIEEGIKRTIEWYKNE